MANLPIVDANELSAGINLNMQNAVGAGDEVDNERGVVLVVHNGGGSAVTVTINSQVADDPPHGSANLVESVPVGAIMQFNLGAVGFSDTANKRAQIRYSAVTGVRVAAFKRINI